MKCPVCKGKGGYKEVILDDGSGPYYPCDYCHDETKVNLFLWIKYWYAITYDFIMARFQ
jgi:hypothetical protein